MGITRRKFLGWMGAASGATAITGQKALAASGRQFNGYSGSKGVLHDITRCIGCRKCEEACNTINKLPDPKKPFDDLTVMNEQRRTSEKTFTVVNQFKNEDSGRDVFVKNQCNHCLEPACASACFVKALRKVDTGAVVYDASVCVGCRYCMIACPFNIPAYEYDNAFTPKVMKCTMCQPLIEKGQVPGCVDICPKEALVFGDRKSLLKIARHRIEKYPDRYVDHIYGEREMGGTSWLYLSGVSYEKIGMREDLGTQSAPQLTAGPLSAVPIIVGLWPVMLTGIYAISKRKDKIAEAERIEAVAITAAKAEEELKDKMAKLQDKMNQEKEAAINREIKRALEEAAQNEETPDNGFEGDSEEKPEEEK